MAPELSVIILSYNQFDRTTGPCLNSLSQINDLDLEIIVVDNNSDVSTLDSLTAAGAVDHRIRLILNKENRGYAGGNNDGVVHALAETIVLLNSDTRVLPNSLRLLADRLKSIPESVVLGPVTSAAGNEQQLFIRPGDVDNIMAQGGSWSRNAAGSFFSTDQLSFFCVAMKKKTYLDLGGLDESFSLGFYEDADFCCRAVKSGVSLQVMEESFVYHAGSASFSTIPETTRKLLKQNGKRFMQKHGRIKSEHVRYKNLQVLQQYAEQLATEGTSTPLAFRLKNRLERARELMPNNPLKKLLYWYQLKKVIMQAEELGALETCTPGN